jgi:hypothetical protein
LTSKKRKNLKKKRRTLVDQPGLELVNDLRGPHKGERVKVDPCVQAELEVGPVSVGDGRQVGRLAADVEVTPAGGEEGGGHGAVSGSAGQRRAAQGCQQSCRQAATGSRAPAAARRRAANP